MDSNKKNNNYWIDKKSKRNNESQPIGDVLGNIIKRPELRQGIIGIRAVEVWPKVMGSMIAKNTTNIYYNKGFLNVYLSSSIIRNELLMRKDKIMESLNEELGGKFIFGISFR